MIHKIDLRPLNVDDIIEITTNDKTVTAKTCQGTYAGEDCYKCCFSYGDSFAIHQGLCYFLCDTLDSYYFEQID